MSPEYAAAHPSRREFAKRIAVLAAAMPVIQSCAAGGVAPPPAAAGAAAPPPPASPGSSDAQPLIDEYVAILRHRVGEHLTAEQLPALREGVEYNLDAADRLRQPRLDISVEPAFVFRAYRREG